jgi:CheY-like chemotaxis protein
MDTAKMNDALPSVEETARILLVEDHAVVRELYATILSGAGYDVTLAADGLEAWERLSAQPYDLLVTDHAMPNLTGVELLRRVREEKKDLPAIMVSGDMPTHEPDLPSLVEPGGLLAKPFTPVALLKAVSSALERGVHCAHSA